MQLGSNCDMALLVLSTLFPPSKACDASLDLSKSPGLRLYLYSLILISNDLLVLPMYSLPHSRGIL